MSPLVLYLFCVYVIAWYLQFSARVPMLEAIRFEFFLAALLSGIAVFRLVARPSDTGNRCGRSPARWPLFLPAWAFESCSPWHR